MCKELELQVEKPAVGGRMIARHDGQVVLVRGAIPGERVRARIEHDGRDVAYAFVTDVLEPDSDRRPVEGDPACGGHVYAHVGYARQLVLKGEIVADAFARIGRVSLPAPVPVAASGERGYRMRARLHVRGARIGFLREGSHGLCDASRTGQLLPETGALLGQLSAQLRAIRPSRVKAIDLAENLAGDQCVLHLELNHESSASHADLARLARNGRVTGLTASRWRGEPPVLLAGIPFVSDPLRMVIPPAATASGGTVLRRQAGSFFQGNRYLLAKLVSRVLEQVPSGEVLDLYAGVGLFTVALAVSGRVPVTAVEGHRLSATDLQANAAPFGGGICVACAPVEDFLRQDSGPAAKTMIVDPPRTGLSRDAADGVIRRSPARIVYVACDVATLARDVRTFLDAGYTLEHIEAFDMFPNTAHVETLVVLGKGGSAMSF